MRPYRVTSSTHPEGDLRFNLTLSEAHAYATELVEGGFSPVISCWTPHAGAYLDVTWGELCTLASES